MSKFRLWALLSFVLLCLLNAHARIKFSVNDHWRFVQRDIPNAHEPGFTDTNWNMVNIPHTWNASDAMDDDMEERIFSVDINGIRQIHNLNIAKEYGEQTAVIRKLVIQAKDGKGISIDFIPVKDEPILNAIRVYRNY